MPDRGSALYLIDTCVLVNFRDMHGDSQNLWDQFGLLIDIGMVKTVRQVWDELERRFPDIHDRLKPRRKTFLIPDGTTYSADVVSEVRAIRGLHPGLYDPLGAGNPADPFLVAVGRIESAIVVTDERQMGKRHKQKIPFVCAQRNVGWMDRLGFFQALGIEP